MPLHDHFHPPWSDENYWQGFHSAWANTLVRHLNLSLLPPRYRAVPQVSLGAMVETEVATFEKNGADNGVPGSESEAAGGVARAVWAPPQPVHSLTVSSPEQDVCEVRILDEERGMRLASLIVVLLCALPASAATEDYLIIFAADSVPYRPTTAHTFAALVTVERTPGHQPRIVDFASISWLPETMKVRPFALSHEKGRNVPLDETLHHYLSTGSRICMWGPFRIQPELAATFRCRVATPRRRKAG